MLLVKAAQESSVDFVHFMIGWLSTSQHKELAKIAEHWLKIQYPEKLAEFKSHHNKEER